MTQQQPEHRPTPSTTAGISHLDFRITCSVGHPGGSTTTAAGRPYKPCTREAIYVSDIHACDPHPDHIHYWCADHLAEHALRVMEIIAEANAQYRCSGCIQCGTHFHEVSDVIKNLTPLNP